MSTLIGEGYNGIAHDLETTRAENAELRAALERAFIAFGRAGGNTLNGPFRPEWEAARAALAKAKGGA